MSSGESLKVRQVTVDSDRAGQRLDNFLMSILGQVPRSLVYRLVRTGQVRVNSSRAKPMQKLKAGDVVRVPPVRLDEPSQVRMPAGLVAAVRSSIIEQNPDFVVLDKPPGLAMHGGTGLSYGLMDAIGEINSNWRPVHRLDRPTSGLLVIACHHQALISLQKAFVDRSVEKRYLALLHGVLPEDRVPVDAPLKKIRDGSGQRRIIVSDDGQSARSTFRVLERLRDFTFVEVAIETGRTHQIRAHAASIGYPVAGDELYNVPAASERLSQGSSNGSLQRLFLHSHYLRLPWPEDRIFSSPLPEELGQVLERLRGTTPNAYEN
ncbi:MAG: RluA family pseudouridine synthase [Wenzhouxiangella sp.]